MGMRSTFKTYNVSCDLPPRFWVFVSNVCFESLATKSQCSSDVRFTTLLAPTAVHDAVMHPQLRLAFHCAAAGLTQNEPVIEQAKKNALPVGNGPPTDPKCFAHAGIARFVLLSVARRWEQCGDAGRGQESARFHRCLNVEHE